MMSAYTKAIEAEINEVKKDFTSLKEKMIDIISDYTAAISGMTEEEEENFLCGNMKDIQNIESILNLLEEMEL